jgi:hypothetical protein
MSGTAKPTRIMDILKRETGGHSYKSHKYSLDESERSAVEHGEADATIRINRQKRKRSTTTRGRRRFKPA